MKYPVSIFLVLFLFGCGSSNKEHSVMDSTLVRDNTTVAEDNLPVVDSVVIDPVATDTLDGVKIEDTDLPPPVVDTLRPVKVTEEPVEASGKKK